MKKAKGKAGDVRALHSPMATRMMKSLQEFWEEHADAWAFFQLLDGPALELAKRKYLTVPVRLDEPLPHRQTA